MHFMTIIHNKNYGSKQINWEKRKQSNLIKNNRYEETTLSNIHVH